MVTEKDIPFVLFYDNGNSVVPSHWHKEIEIIYSLQGNTQMMINDRIFDVREGEMGIAIGGDVHFYLCSQNHRRMVVMFDMDIFEDERSHGRTKAEVKKRLENMVQGEFKMAARAAAAGGGDPSSVGKADHRQRFWAEFVHQSTHLRFNPAAVQRSAQEQYTIQHVHQYQSDQNARQSGENHRLCGAELSKEIVIG